MENAGRAINIHLGSELKARWVKYCAGLGVTPGAAIKGAIERQLAAAAPVPPKPQRKFQQKGRPAAGEKKERVELLLTKSEKAAVLSRAETEECSSRRWMIDAIRAGLTHEPQFGMVEVVALGQSNYQLLHIGRNLNQIARRLNEDRRAPLAIESIQQLHAQIDLHPETVSKAVQASLERWNLK